MEADVADDPSLKRIKWGFRIAVAGALLGLVMFPWNPIGALFWATAFGAAAFGISRRRAWSAYGCALLSLVSVLATVMVFATATDQPNTRGLPIGAAIITIAWYACVAFLLIRAGNAIRATGGSRGLAWPWCAAGMLLLLFFLCFRAFVNPTGSMEKTLLVGDRLIARTVLTSFQRGDVMIFHYPVDPKQIFVKRVIGMAGDRISIKDKQLFVNGARMNEPFAQHAVAYTDAYRDNFPSEPNTMIYPQAAKMLEQNVANGEVVVPPDRYFVLGDNRDLSLDSRYWGFVSKSEVIGKPVMVYYSVALDPREPSTDALTPPLPRNIRWNRFFRTID